MFQKSESYKEPRHDDIQYVILAYHPNETVVQITYISNTSINPQYFPYASKQAIIVPIRKPKTNSVPAESYLAQGYQGHDTKAISVWKTRHLQKFVITLTELQPWHIPEWTLYLKICQKLLQILIWY